MTLLAMLSALDGSLLDLAMLGWALLLGVFVLDRRWAR